MITTTIIGSVDLISGVGTTAVITVRLGAVQGEVVTSTDKAIVLSSLQSITTATDGSFTINLIPTDIFTTNMYYIFMINGQTYYKKVPSSGVPVNFVDLADVDIS